LAQLLDPAVNQSGTLSATEINIEDDGKVVIAAVSGESRIAQA
jgi:hypothetical protein